MNIIGLDIGTTTLSAVAVDGETRLPLARRTIAHDSFIPGEPYEKMQDAEKIVSLAQELIESLSAECAPVSVIGLTGQMHGIVYVDGEGRAVSPLYIWQDGRGNLPMADGRRFADALSEETGYSLATGYGSVTHAHLLRNGEIPQGAAKMCTIHAYLGMILTGRRTPLLHASDAASLGCFDIQAGRFDAQAVGRIGGEYFPETTREVCVLGKTGTGAKVIVGVGDNQASFLGAMGGDADAVLVNIGTGSQVSMRTEGFASCPGCETRPLDGDECLLVGAPLCGGRAYAMLEKFLRACAALAGTESGPLYERMNELVLDPPDDPIAVDTAFCGTRSQPEARGSIMNLGEENFTPAHLIHGTLTGMARELYEYYRAMVGTTGRPASRLVASGNAVRLNPALQKILAEMFGMPLSLTPFAEEAAMGAAYLAAGFI